MKQKWKWVIVGIIAIIVVFAIWRAFNAEDRFFDKVELTQDNYVRNTTNLPYLDTVIKVGLDVLEIKNSSIFARPLTIKNDGDIDYKAHILSNNLNHGTIKQYLIEIDKTNRTNIIRNLSHELIHLRQYQSGTLTVTKDYVIWKGDTIKNNIPDYFNRPWEVEARKDGRVLENSIRDILYPKN
jgi:hypothetical protein